MTLVRHDGLGNILPADATLAPLPETAPREPERYGIDVLVFCAVCEKRCTLNVQFEGVWTGRTPAQQAALERINDLGWRTVYVLSDDALAGMQKRLQCPECTAGEEEVAKA